jgi:hypothetical protein
MPAACARLHQLEVIRSEQADEDGWLLQVDLPIAEAEKLAASADGAPIRAAAGETAGVVRQRPGWGAGRWPAAHRAGGRDIRLSSAVQRAGSSPHRHADVHPHRRRLNAQSAALGQRLQQASLQLVTAESCSGGWIAKCMTDIAGSSAFFDCGMVVYSYEAKQRLLGVRADWSSSVRSAAKPCWKWCPVRWSIPVPASPWR